MNLLFLISRVAPNSTGAGAQSRRVVVKVRVVRTTAYGAKAAALHLRYIERDGVDRYGSKGALYGREGPERADSFAEPRAGEKHPFRSWYLRRTQSSLTGPPTFGGTWHASAGPGTTARVGRGQPLRYRAYARPRRHPRSRPARTGRACGRRVRFEWPALGAPLRSLRCSPEEILAHKPALEGELRGHSRS
jgi:hypothetical protein